MREINTKFAPALHSLCIDELAMKNHVLSAFRSIQSWALALALFATIQTVPNFVHADGASCIAALEQINVLNFWTTPDPAGHKPFIDAILDPKTTLIELSMFHLTDPAVVQAFETRAAQGNFTARIILDRSNLRDDSTLQIALGLQKLPGVSVVASNAAFSLTHTKYMRVNGVISFVTTINLTTNLTAQRDWGMTTDNVNVGKEIDAVFANDYALGDSDLAKVAQEEKNKDPGQKNVPPDPKLTPPLSMPNLLWSPTNSTTKIVALIDYADPGTELISTVENIRNPDVQAAFLRAAARGVKVRLIVPEVDQNPDPNFNLQAVWEMQNQVVNGQNISVEVRLMPGPETTDTPYMHAKMIMATGKSGTLLAIMSENFSGNSLDFARELGIIFSNPNAIQMVQTAFERDWGVSVVPPPKPPPAPPKTGS